MEMMEAVWAGLLALVGIGAGSMLALLWAAGQDGRRRTPDRVARPTPPGAPSSSVVHPPR